MCYVTFFISLKKPLWTFAPPDKPAVSFINFKKNVKKISIGLFQPLYVLLLNEEVIEDSSKLMQSLVGYHKSATWKELSLSEWHKTSTNSSLLQYKR